MSHLYIVAYRAKDGRTRNTRGQRCVSSYGCQPGSLARHKLSTKLNFKDLEVLC